MASDQSFMNYVCEQVGGAGQISHRKLFGEYALYCDGKVVALVCDNQLFIKDTAAGRSLLPEIKEGQPYPGAKPWLMADEWLDDEAMITRVIRQTAAAVPSPAPRTPRATGKTPVRQRPAKRLHR